MGLINRITIPKFLFNLIVVLAALFVLVPFLVILLTSFKTMPELNDVAGRSLMRRILPDDITNLNNYWALLNGEAEQLNGISFLVFIFNSLIVVVVSLLPSVFFSVSAGYGLARYRFPFKKLFFFFFLGILMIPMEMVSIPLYQVLASLMLTNTYLGIMIPGMISAFGIFMMYEVLGVIPQDYIDYGRIEGANEFVIFFRLIAPMAKGSIFTFMLIKFLWTWNDYFWPYLVIRTEEMKTIPVALSKFTNDLFQVWPQLTAALVLSILPTFILFISSRRFIVRGIANIGIKG